MYNSSGIRIGCTHVNGAPPIIDDFYINTIRRTDPIMIPRNPKFFQEFILFLSKGITFKRIIYGVKMTDPFLG